MADVAEIFRICQRYNISPEELKTLIEEYISAVGKYEVIRTRLCPSQNGAIYRLKRAVYATITKNKCDLDESKKLWGSFVSLMIKELDEKVGREKLPTQIILHYKIEDGVFYPIAAEVNVYRPEKRIVIKNPQFT